jgi:hypothetical protein
MSMAICPSFPEDTIVGYSTIHPEILWHSPRTPFLATARKSAERLPDYFRIAFKLTKLHSRLRWLSMKAGKGHHCEVTSIRRAREIESESAGASSGALRVRGEFNHSEAPELLWQIGTVLRAASLADVASCRERGRSLRHRDSCAASRSATAHPAPAPRTAASAVSPAHGGRGRRCARRNRVCATSREI